jgi:hypothetical protein
MRRAAGSTHYKAGGKLNVYRLYMIAGVAIAGCGSFAGRRDQGSPAQLASLFRRKILLRDVKGVVQHG